MNSAGNIQDAEYALMNDNLLRLVSLMKANNEQVYQQTHIGCSKGKQDKRGIWLDGQRMIP